MLYIKMQWIFYRMRPPSRRAVEGRHGETSALGNPVYLPATLSGTQREANNIVAYSYDTYKIVASQ
jgi:hypothetical protein